PPRHLSAAIVQMPADSEEHAVVLHDHHTGLLGFSGLYVIAGIAAGLHVHPRGIDILAGCRAAFGCTLVGNRDFEIDLIVRSFRWVVDHRLDANFVALLHTVAVAGYFSPVGHLAARTEDMFFLVGAEKIGAILVPERRVMEQ